MDALPEPHFAFDVVLTPRSSRRDVVRAFLGTGRRLVLDEPGTLQWYGYQTPGAFGMFDTFATEEGRAAHARGLLAQALAGADDVVARVAPVDVIGHRVARGVQARGGLKVGVRFVFRAKPEAAAEVRAALRDGAPDVQREPLTPYWYAFQKDATTFGVFVLFYDEADRREHLEGLSAGHLLDTISAHMEAPADRHFFDVIACKTPPGDI
ncbi:hypothetical protein BC834DRAFT_353341 [Gloeopeniophorella convolvens]|nr:hypothetical protein BC834DRAFT_353341 [Gloeopeniophorella convolvens]